ncbi:hypothetical protein N2152v2_007109 [Parachlorella kessleri]
MASSPPSSWYTSETALRAETDRVFRTSWQLLGHTSRLEREGDYFTGQLFPAAPFLACKDQQGHIRAFHNVCRHHAAAVAAGSGNTDCFSCPYHGWTYGLDGRLLKAVGLKGIQMFKAAESGLAPLQVARVGPWIFGVVGSGRDADVLPQLETCLGPEGLRALMGSGACREQMVHVASRVYPIGCNWKVFCDNYLDGGYHVAVAHPDLAASLDLASYTSNVYETLSIQSCQPRSEGERLAGGLDAAYAFIFPNIMINSYGPWIDTNVVLPTGPESCKVIFDYYLEHSRAQDKDFVAASLAASDQVQQEDIGLCESVQRGLASPAYDVGRYVPRFEGAMHHFHRLLNGSIDKVMTPAIDGMVLM